MGIVYNTKLLDKGIRGEFIKALSTAPSVVGELATVVSSDKASEDYAWLGEVSGVNEFLDERQIQGFSDAKYTITNKTWEKTLALKRSELEDDQTGMLPIRIADMATRARQHQDELFYYALLRGSTDTGYDGDTFFNTAHSKRGKQTATQSNKLTGTGTTVAAFKTDIQAAVQKLLVLVDEGGKPFWPSIDFSKLVALVPPSNLFNFQEAAKADVISNTTNMLRGVIGKILPAAFLEVGAGGATGDANDWVLYYAGSPVKPVILQERVPITIETPPENSDAEFMRETRLYGTRGRYNAGYGLWQGAILTTNT